MIRLGLCADVRNIKEIEELGFDFVDGKLSQVAALSDEEFEEVMKIVSSASIKVEKMAILLPKTMSVIGEKYNEEEMIAYLEGAFSRMKRLGADVISFGSGKSRMIPEGMNYQTAFAQLVHVTTVIATVAAKYGIKVAIEPLNRNETNLINTLAEGAALQAMVNMENVGLLADAYHMQVESENMKKLVFCSPLMHTHIALKDGRKYPTENLPEVEEFFTLLKEAGYDGTLSIEGKSEDWKVDSVKALSVMRAYAN
ncbi:MAG: TIM barrel protein [Spirochaetales bacterium]|nr:TIM barrel protein [Candidatus Physcosoma equi]